MARVLSVFTTERCTHLYLIICLIWRFMVTKNRMHQYMSRMGQNTGTSNTRKNVRPDPMRKDLNEDHLHGEGCSKP